MGERKPTGHSQDISVDYNKENLTITSPVRESIIKTMTFGIKLNSPVP